MKKIIALLLTLQLISPIVYCDNEITINGRRGSGHIIADEGTKINQRAIMNFTGGAVSVADTSGRTTVTINPTIGGLISGGTNNAILYTDGSGNLASSSNLTFNEITSEFGLNGTASIVSTSTPQLSLAYDAINSATFNVDSSGNLTFGGSGGNVTITDNLWLEELSTCEFVMNETSENSLWYYTADGGNAGFILVRKAPLLSQPFMNFISDGAGVIDYVSVLGADLWLADSSKKLYFGTTRFASITDDGTDFIFDSKDSGVGDFKFMNGTLGVYPDNTSGILVQREGEAKIRLDTYGATAYPIWSSQRANGTIGSPTAITNGMELFVLNTNAYDGLATQTAGQLLCSANQNFTGAAHGVKWLLKGAKNGSTSVTTWLQADNGNFNFQTGILTSSRYISSVATGTSPYTCASTTLNTNLNADLWDGYQFSDYLNQAVKTTSSPTFVGLTLSGAIATPTNITASGTITGAKFVGKTTRAAQVTLAELGTDNSGAGINDEASLDFLWYNTLKTGRISGWVKTISGAGSGGLKFYTAASGNSYNATPALILDDDNYATFNTGAGIKTTPIYPLHIKLDAADSRAIHLDGDTNVYTGTGAGYPFIMNFVRTLNCGNGNEPDNPTGFHIKMTSDHDLAMMDADKVMISADFQYFLQDNWENDSASNRVNNLYNLRSHVVDGATYTASSTGYAFMQPRIISSWGDLTPTLVSSGGQTNYYYAKGLDVDITLNPTVLSGTWRPRSYGVYIDINGTTAGASIGYGIYFEGVSGADSNYAIWDASDADWVMYGDNKSLRIGAALADFVLYSDGTQGVIQTGVANLIIKGANTSADPKLTFASGNDGYIQWQEDETQFHVDGGFETSTFINAGGGIILPTSDPHIVDAWWDNSGTLTKSSG